MTIIHLALASAISMTMTDGNFLAIRQIDVAATADVPSILTENMSKNYRPPETNSENHPDLTNGGATRGECDETEFPLTAIVPTNVPDGGYTAAEAPTTWVYVPYALVDNNPATLLLEDSSGTRVYESPVITELGEPGVMGVELPTLDLGETYVWTFEVYCGDPDRLDVPEEVQGWIERVEPEAFPIEQRWYDVLTEAATQRRISADDTTWRGLMEFVEQDGMDTVPMTSCCTLPSEVN